MGRVKLPNFGVLQKKGLRGLGLRVWGSGFRVKGLRGLGLRVSLKARYPERLPAVGFLREPGKCPKAHWRLPSSSFTSWLLTPDRKRERERESLLMMIRGFRV